MADDTEQVPVGLGQMQPIFEAVGKRYKIPPAMITSRPCSSTQKEARQLCCWLASKLTRLSMQEIGDAVGRGKTSVGQALARIDRLRVDEALIAKLSDEILAELRGGQA